MEITATSAHVPGAVRALLAPLVSSGGVIPRCEVAAQLLALAPSDRAILRRAGLTIGTLDVFDPKLLNPDAQRVIRIFRAVFEGDPTQKGHENSVIRGASAPAYRCIDGEMIRVDVIERIARALHDVRNGSAPFVPDAALARSLGLKMNSFDATLRAIGFRAVGNGQWAWRFRPARRVVTPKTPSPAFAALEQWTGVKRTRAD